MIFSYRQLAYSFFSILIIEKKCQNTKENHENYDRLSVVEFISFIQTKDAFPTKHLIDSVKQFC